MKNLYNKPFSLKEWKSSEHDRRQKLKVIIANMPKVELHRHLEGSLRITTLRDIAQRYDLDVPFKNIRSFRSAIQVLNEQVNYKKFLAKFNTLRKFYRTPEIIYQMAYEAVIDAANENIRYLELQFSPQALTAYSGFSYSDVVDWVIKASQDASKDRSITVGLLISIVRHDPLEQAFKVAHIAFDKFGSGVVGINLTGDEVGYSAIPFKPIFDEAYMLGMGITVHAGEWGHGKGIRKAIECLHAQRIGHGISIFDDHDALYLAKERAISFELCLTSNIRTGAVKAIKAHPIIEMYNAGLKVTINTDDPGIFDITLNDEYELITTLMANTTEDLTKMVRNASEAVFLPPNEKTKLIKDIDKQLIEFSTHCNEDVIYATDKSRATGDFLYDFLEYN